MRVLCKYWDQQMCCLPYSFVNWYLQCRVRSSATYQPSSDWVSDRIAAAHNFADTVTFAPPARLLTSGHLCWKARRSPGRSRKGSSIREFLRERALSPNRYYQAGRIYWRGPWSRNHAYSIALWFHRSNLLHSKCLAHLTSHTWL